MSDDVTAKLLAKAKQKQTTSIVEETPKVAPKSQPTLDVLVISEFKVIFEGKANSVSAVNEDGPFDVLPKHHNFITLLPKSMISIDSGGQIMEFEVEKSLLIVSDDKLKIFTSIG